MKIREFALSVYCTDIPSITARDFPVVSSHPARTPTPKAPQHLLPTLPRARSPFRSSDRREETATFNHVIARRATIAEENMATETLPTTNSRSIEDLVQQKVSSLSSVLDPSISDLTPTLTTLMRCLYEMHGREPSVRFHVFMDRDYKPPGAPTVGSRLCIIY